MQIGDLGVPRLRWQAGFTVPDSTPGSSSSSIQHHSADVEGMNMCANTRRLVTELYTYVLPDERSASRAYNTKLPPCRHSLRVLCNHVHHRPFVSMPGVEYIHERGEAHQTHKQHASPVEVCGRDLIRVWEERPDEAPARVDERNDVDGQTSSTETPTTLGKWEVVNATVSDTAWERSVSKALL